MPKKSAKEHAKSRVIEFMSRPGTGAVRRAQVDIGTGGARGTAAAFDELVTEGRIVRRGGWYRLAPVDPGIDPETVFDFMRRTELTEGKRCSWVVEALAEVFVCSVAALRKALEVLGASDRFDRRRVVNPNNGMVELGPEFGIPVDLADLVQLVLQKFPRESQSNPFYFGLSNQLFEDCGQPRAGALWYAFKKAEEQGAIVKLPDGEEYAWTGKVELREEPKEEPPVVEQPAARPATPPLPLGLGQIASDREVSDVVRHLPPSRRYAGLIMQRSSPPQRDARDIDAETLCREVVWRLATGKLSTQQVEAINSVVFMVAQRRKDTP